MTTMQQLRDETPEEKFRTLFARVAELNDRVSALFAPAWGASAGILPDDHPLHPGVAGPLPNTVEGKPRLLDCGLCYEENGEECHPHPECPLGVNVPRARMAAEPGTPPAGPAGASMPSIHRGDVAGFCPACGHGVLMLGSGGHVTCTLIDCPNPSAADQLLHGEELVVPAAATEAIGRPCTCAGTGFGDGTCAVHYKPAAVDESGTRPVFVVHHVATPQATPLDRVDETEAAPTKTRPGDQPLPNGGQQCVQDALIAKIEERKQLGVQRYGSVLMTHNGRDAGQDMVEEAVDLAVYSMQVAMELRDLRANVEQYRHLRAVAGVHCDALGNLLHDAGIRMPDSALRMYLLLQDELTLTLDGLARQRPNLFPEAGDSEAGSARVVHDLATPQASEPEEVDQEGPEADTCRPVDIGGETIRVHGVGEMSAASREALAEIVAATRRRFEAEHPPYEVADPERREWYAQALYATLEVTPRRHPWETLSPLRRAVWYARAEAAMAMADAELAELAGETGPGHLGLDEPTEA